MAFPSGVQDTACSPPKMAHNCPKISCCDFPEVVEKLRNQPETARSSSLSFSVGLGVLEDGGGVKVLAELEVLAPPPTAAVAGFGIMRGTDCRRYMLLLEWAPLLADIVEERGVVQVAAYTEKEDKDDDGASPAPPSSPPPFELGGW